MKKLLLRTVSLAAAGLLSIALGMSAFAATDDEKDYSIGDASWDVREDGIYATWDEPEDKTGYSVKLIRNDKSVGNYSVNSGTEEKELSQAIVDKGKGTYRFQVYGSKVKKSEREDNTAESDDLVVSSDDSGDITLADVKEIAKKAAAASKAKGSSSSSSSASTNGAAGPGAASAASSTATGWVQNSDGTWGYKLNSTTLATATWQMVGGQWYYFNNQGVMQIGWQWIPGSDGLERCYYLEPAANGALPQGACWMNATTPDNYLVDSTGAWVVDGVVQTRAAASTPAQTNTASSSVSSQTNKGYAVVGAGGVSFN